LHNKDNEYLNKLQKYFSNTDLNFEKLQNDLYLKKKEIDDIIANYDNIELISQISFFWDYIYPILGYSRMLEMGGLNFLIGLCLKNELSDKKPISDNLSHKMYNLVEDYCDLNNFISMYKNKNKTELNDLAFYLESYKLLNNVNYGGYQFQFNDYTRYVFQPLENFNKNNFTVSNTISYSNIIFNRFKQKVEKDIELYQKSHEMFEQKKEESQNNPEESYIENLKKNLIGSVTKPFIINPQEMCREAKIEDCSRFRRYLDSFSCSFGSQDSNFNFLQDNNLLYTKPIIKLNSDKYFCPSPKLLFNYHILFPDLLSINSQNPKVNDKYNKLKSSYLENRAKNFLLKIFPNDSVYNNLYYFPNKGDINEIDMLVKYDNKIIIFEAKSGSITEPSFRGYNDRIKTDLGKIFGKANSQGNKAIEYIKINPNTKFYDEKQHKILLELKEPSNKLEYYKIILTLIPLFGLATDSKTLSQVIQFQNDFPLNLSIFDLEIITNHILSPSIFIDYIEQRIMFQKNNNFPLFNELHFLNNYLKFRNFSNLKSFENNFNIESIYQIKDTLDEFDSVYGNYDSDRSKLSNLPNNEINKPLLHINQKIKELINLLEAKRFPDHTKIVKKLLELNQNQQIKLTRKFNSIKGRPTCRTGSYKSNSLDFGFTFIIDEEKQHSEIIKLNEDEKKNYKAKTWIGIHMKNNEIINIIYTE
jgi:hypothetical protein